MEKKRLTKIEEIIPEFYFDVIARIIPGALTLLVYNWNKLNNFQSFTQLITALLLSYLIGIILDISSDVFLGRILFRFLFLVLKILHMDLYNDGDLWLRIRKLKEEQITVFNKMMAEKAMMRSLVLVNIFVLIFPPSYIPLNKPILIGILSLVILLFCNLCLQLYVTERIRNI